MERANVSRSNAHKPLTVDANDNTASEMDRNAHLHAEQRWELPQLHECSRYPVHRLWDVLQHKIKIYFLLFLSSLVKVVLQCDNVGVFETLDHLQFTVLETAVLQHLLDCHNLSCLNDTGLKHDTKTPITDDALRQ